MLKLNDVYRRVEDKWVSRFILDEVVIMPLCRSQEDMQYIYSLSNETSSKLWQLLDGSNSVKDIREILKREYQGQAEVIERDVLEFIGDVFEAGLVEKAQETKDKGREPTIESPQSSSPQLKRTYKTLEIARIKMQPEQAVLSCCINVAKNKSSLTAPTFNTCHSATCRDMATACRVSVPQVWQQWLDAGST